MFIGKKLSYPLSGFGRKTSFYCRPKPGSGLVVPLCRLTFYRHSLFAGGYHRYGCGLLCGFQNNQAYDRLWEARRLWGGFTNVSRTLAASFISLVKDKDIQKTSLPATLPTSTLCGCSCARPYPWATNNEDYHRQVVSEADEVKQFDHAIVELFQSLDKMDVYEKSQTQGQHSQLCTALPV